MQDCPDSTHRWHSPLLASGGTAPLVPWWALLVESSDIESHVLSSAYLTKTGIQEPLVDGEYTKNLEQTPGASGAV